MRTQSAHRCGKLVSEDRHEPIPSKGCGSSARSRQPNTDSSWANVDSRSPARVTAGPPRQTTRRPSPAPARCNDCSAAVQSGRRTCAHRPRSGSTPQPKLTGARPSQAPTGMCLNPPDEPTRTATPPTTSNETADAAIGLRRRRLASRHEGPHGSHHADEATIRSSPSVTRESRQIRAPRRWHEKHSRATCRGTGRPRWTVRSTWESSWTKQLDDDGVRNVGRDRRSAPVSPTSDAGADHTVPAVTRH